MLSGVACVLLYFYIASIVVLDGVSAAVFYGSVSVGVVLFLHGLFDSSRERAIVVIVILWAGYSLSVYSA
jgi:hypothetical protein